MSKATFTRRQWLRTTAGAAGASVAARTILLDPEVSMASPRQVPPSDRVGFGMRPQRADAAQ